MDKNNYKIKVVFFGTGKSREIIETLINDRVDIVCYIDNDSRKVGEKIKEVKFDYVIIASQYNKEIFEQLKNTGVKEELIFQFYKFSSIFETYIKKTLSNYLENKHEKYKAVFTGISYFYKGILT